MAGGPAGAVGPYRQGSTKKRANSFRQRIGAGLGLSCCGAQQIAYCLGTYSFELSAPHKKTAMKSKAARNPCSRARQQISAIDRRRQRRPALDALTRLQ